MSNMKCPVCNIPLNECGDLLCCPNDHCAWVGNKELWQELIRTKELLEIEDAEHSMCHTQMLKTTEKLERTRKALDVAVDALKRTDWCAQDYAIAQEALKEITALKQKDVK